jgi:hypothetical protein
MDFIMIMKIHDTHTRKRVISCILMYIDSLAVACRTFEKKKRKKSEGKMDAGRGRGGEKRTWRREEDD